MAAGDLVVANQQYEFWRSDTDRLLIGSGTDIRVEKVEGLFRGEVRQRDLERSSWHGSYAGAAYLAEKRPIFSLMIRPATQAELETIIEDTIPGFMYPKAGTQMILTFQRPGMPKRRILVEPRRWEFITDYEVAHGLAKGPIEFFAGDPHIYASAATDTDITLAADVANRTVTVTNGGKVPTLPVITITGPATSIRVKNATDANREIRLDNSDNTAYTLPAGQVMVIDILNRTLTVQGVDRYDLVRNDNQWWKLLPGANSITYTRSGVITSASPATITHRAAWV